MEVDVAVKKTRGSVWLGASLSTYVDMALMMGKPPEKVLRQERLSLPTSPPSYVGTAIMSELYAGRCPWCRKQVTHLDEFHDVFPCQERRRAWEAQKKKAH